MMKKTTMMGFGVAAVFASGAAMAETVSVPCEEFAQTTGKRMPCDKVPVLKMPREQWDKEKAAAQVRASTDPDVPPWKRSGKPEASPRQKTLAETDPCSLPPWKRPSGVKCN
jgi:hypothetical protein